jgi:hypothetical protein
MSFFKTNVCYFEWKYVYVCYVVFKNNILYYYLAISPVVPHLFNYTTRFIQNAGVRFIIPREFRYYFVIIININVYCYCFLFCYPFFFSLFF